MPTPRSFPRRLLGALARGLRALLGVFRLVPAPPARPGIFRGGVYLFRGGR